MQHLILWTSVCYLKLTPTAHQAQTPWADIQRRKRSKTIQGRI